MVNPDIITAKLGELVKRLDRIVQKRSATVTEMTADQDTLDLLSFHLMLAVQLCLDCASHIIGDEAWPPAATLAESFRRLEEHRVISRETAEALGRASGFRNVIAHGYAEVDPALVFTASHEGETDLRQFAWEVGAWVKQHIT